eukprot:9287120-Pyramimonas_sp.AAC.1
MDLEAFDVETCSGTARPSSQRLLASMAACKKQWIIASLDINMAFLKRLTYHELAEATGEKERAVCFTLPPGSATVLRAPPGFEHHGERATRGFGPRPASYDEEFESSNSLLTAKHVDDINMAGTEDTVDKYVKCVEATFGVVDGARCIFTTRPRTNQRSSATTERDRQELQACPKKTVYQTMNPTGEVDLHSDSGYHRLSGDADDDVEGYGIRGANLLRRGNTSSGKLVVHLIDAHCKSRRSQARSSYSAETLAAARDLED